MTPKLLRLGAARSPVVVIDDATGAAREIVRLAASLAPFPKAKDNLYPGLRRMLGPADGDAFAYVERTLESLAPFIGGAFGFDSFTLSEASFSLVTAPPETLAPAQRAPHFDSVDPNYLAILHYLSDTPASGTAFYRHRATSVEEVGPGDLDRYVETARRENAEAGGYVCGSNKHYEQIGAVESKQDRIAIYRGCLLHSGTIPPELTLSGDPARGRLTANIFVAGA